MSHNIGDVVEYIDNRGNTFEATVRRCVEQPLDAEGKKTRELLDVEYIEKNIMHKAELVPSKAGIEGGVHFGKTLKKAEQPEKPKPEASTAEETPSESNDTDSDTAEPETAPSEETAEVSDSASSNSS